MRVLVLSNLYPPDVIGGYEVACAQAVDALAARGHDVLVLTSVPRRPVPSADHVARRFRLSDEWSSGALGSFNVVHERTHARSRFVDAGNVHELIRTVDEFRPDVAYLHSLIGLGGLGLVVALGHLGVPWVWHLGDCVPVRLCSSRYGIIPELAAAYGRQVTGHYVAVSEGVFRETERLGVPLQGPVTLVPYWINGNRPPQREAYFRPGERPFRIMSAGSVNRDKGCDVLIEAAARLREIGVRDFEVDIYGRVGDPSLAELVRSLDLDAHVRLRGPRPHREILELYGHYDVFAFPTQEREPFGIVALEAASRGCLPVMTRCCGASEWLVHGVHCVKAARSPRSFADAFAGLATGTVPVAPLARRAAEAAWADFHLDRVIPRIEAVLRAEARRGGTRGLPDAEVYHLARLAESVADRLVEEAAPSSVNEARLTHGLRQRRGA